MGKTQRKTSQLLVNVQRSLRAKIITILECGSHHFTLDNFINLFEEVYPEEHQQLTNLHLFYSEKKSYRHKGKPLYFPTPTELLVRQFQIHRNKASFPANEEERLSRKNAALNISKERYARNQKKYEDKNISTQHVLPSHITNQINNYWREHDPYNRLRIVEECGKFKHQITISFLRSVVSCERNWDVAHKAFLEVQKFTEFIYLPKKKRVSAKFKERTKEATIAAIQRFNKPRQPEDVIHDHVNDQPYQRGLNFDVFVSHSLADAKTVKKIKNILNADGLTIFVDWIYDANDLDRKRSNQYTPEALKIRLKQSKSLLLLRSDESDNSPWVAWEIGYYMALDKEIIVLNLPSSKKEKPDYLAMCTQAEIIENYIFINNNREHIRISEWISRTTK